MLGKTIALLLVMAITVGVTTTTQRVQAGAFEDLGRDLDNCLKNCLNNYNDGVKDGKDAALAGEAKNCPGSGGDYCLGWTTGYNQVSHAQDTLNNAQAQREDRDDGEFVDGNDPAN